MFTLQKWEDDEYVICINGKPAGQTVSKGCGYSILGWLNSLPRTLIDILVFEYTIKNSK